MNPQIIALAALGTVFLVILAMAALMTHYAHQNGR